MNVKINFISTEVLPAETLFSFYLGNDEKGYYEKHRALTNGTVQVQGLDSDEWRTV